MKSLRFGPWRPSFSVVQGLAGQRSGLVRPLQLQRSLNTHFTQQLELSKHIDVQTTNAGAVNDLDVDITEKR